MSHSCDILNATTFSFLSESTIIYNISVFVTTHKAFNIADPNSMQNGLSCMILLKKQMT